MSTLRPGSAVAPEVQRRRVTVRGVVQGVGFRPFLYTLATSLELAGHVTNTEHGVVAEVEGAHSAVASFCDRIAQQAPPLALVESVEHEQVPPAGGSGFAIIASLSQGPSRTLVSPDTATCAACLAEMADPGDRRHRHPFITCTHCGPRFTIVTGLPYDRAHTTMAGFPMCPDCTREYTDPGDRRFHAQPVACHACGPRLSLVYASPRRATDVDPIHEARALLGAGAILAVKGLGGYHLACDAENSRAVAALRSRKGRGGKPFALMVKSIADIEHLVHVSPAERALLTGGIRPIVLLRRRIDASSEECRISDAVAPGSPDLGVMLPYTPVHHLLLGLPGDPDGPRLLVMTSGNMAGEPIVTGDAEAQERLSPIADAWLTHDRPIHVPCDDSVLRVCDGERMTVRRARGYAPLPISLPVSVRPSLAVGGDLKNTFCLGDGRRAWLSAHIGDMDDLETQRAFGRAEQQLETITGVKPGLLAADLHPGYRSGQWAQRHANSRRVVRVQHHHAHVAAVMAEHGLDGSRPVIGIAFDGTGYGDDGAVWGGEILLADYERYRRLGHLSYVPLPGGDASVHRPYRMALSHLREAGIAWTDDLPSVTACPDDERRVLARQLERSLNCVPTSSMGRLFDAVSSLAGVCHLAGYEAQAAIELEAAALKGAVLKGAGAGDSVGYRFSLSSDTSEPMTADPGPVVRAVVDDVRAGTAPEVVAARFHTAVADLARRICATARDRHGTDTVVLTGGVFANALLSSDCAGGLREDGFTVLRAGEVPPNDGGLSLGQLMIAGRATAG
ncbi:carbamoyltransferase HypF [Streptomyces sp. NPDC058297]|uniref:carbamoyltransferase HypF n=1 Tax=Streptomyces sp. NPDC058297 TaxID=3346433 RepID=UPI0036EE62F7